jgi:hypothetical protein
MRHDGGCHCGAVRVRYESDRPPGETEVRACQCSFCRKHGARAVSDPQGRVRIEIHEPGTVRRYRFGLATADFLVCGRCGVYVAAVLNEEGAAFAIVILNALDRPEGFDRVPMAVDYAAESEAERRRRRRERWTPAEIVERG